MAVELKVPDLGESINEVQIGAWLIQEGEYAKRDEPVVEIESEKATVELVAPVGGKVTQILKKTGDTAAIGAIVGYMEASEAPEASATTAAKGAGAPSASPDTEQRVMPAARRALAEAGVDAKDVQGSGPGGRLLKEDVQAHVAAAQAAAPAQGSREEEIVPMSPMRRAIAKHLVNAQQVAALLTTFNEIDMSAVMALRSGHKAAFEKKYGIKLGFMSFFVKASVEALKEVPEVNAEIRDDKIVYRNYQDIAVAIGTPKGLVTPVLRNAEAMGFAEIELAIAEFARKARENKLSMDELRGGTFTISNGGVYGSLLSTPIVNAPQSGILGMHTIQERPVAVDGEVVIRPMMYIALTYDHRVIDGRGAVTCLKRIKECVENPARILLEI